MGRRVTSFVHVQDVAGGRDGVFGPEDKVPAWAVALIDNESVWGDDDGESEPEQGDDGKPAGNASTEAWQEYAKSQGATDEELDGKSRDELRDTYGK